MARHVRQGTELPLLTAAVTPEVPAVLASPFDVNTASSYGVIICEGAGPVQRMRGLVEKPGRTEACQLLAERGACSRAHPVDVVTTTQPMTDLGLDTDDL